MNRQVSHLCDHYSASQIVRTPLGPSWVSLEMGNVCQEGISTGLFGIAILKIHFHRVIIPGSTHELNAGKEKKYGAHYGLFDHVYQLWYIQEVAT